MNLIPLPHRRLKKSRRHLSVCAAACAALMGLTAAYVGAAAILVDSDPHLNDDLAEAKASIERHGKKVATLTTETTAARARLQAAMVVNQQPDWSILLALLGEKTGDDVMLRACRVKPIEAVATPKSGAPAVAPKPAAKPSAATLDIKFTIELSGVARNQMAVSQFVLRLEQAGLFDRVTLLDTIREPFLSGEASGFHVECALSGAIATFDAEPASRITSAKRVEAKNPIAATDPSEAQ